VYPSAYIQPFDMVNRHIPEGCKLAAVMMYLSGKMDLDDEILPLVGISRATFYRCLSLWRNTGNVIPAPSGLRGRPRLLVVEDIDWLLEIIAYDPDTFLDEFDDLLRTNRFIAVHYSTICRALQAAGISRKRISKIAIERDDILRGHFVRTMSAFTPEQLGFIDETSKDERTWARRYGRARRGRRIIKKAPFVRGTRLSGTGLLTIDGMMASTVCEGSMTAEKLMKWLEEEVVSHYHGYVLRATVEVAPPDPFDLSLPWPSQCDSA
jgi:transposase